MRRVWILGIALVLAVLLWARCGLPAFVENQLNRVTPHAPWVVSEEAQALHQNLLIADLHADPLLWQRDWLQRSARGHTDLPRFQDGGVTLQVFTAVTQSPSGQNYESNEAGSDTITYLAIAQGWPISTWTHPSERALYQAKRLAEWDERGGEQFQIVENQQDLWELITLRASGKWAVGGIFGIEGAHALEGRIENLDRLEALGLRVIGLTHFFDNRVGGSLHGVSHEGLTPFGQELIVEASRRRMIIDVAHASPQMVRDVLELSKRPVILSHGGFKGLCDTARNLEDELMIELAQQGALIGVGFWDGAVCDTSPEGVARAIQYGIDLLGVDHIALGSDYDGATEVAFDSSELSILTEHLLQLGLSPNEIRLVMGENAIRFFLEQLP